MYVAKIGATFLATTLAIYSLSMVIVYSGSFNSDIGTAQGMGAFVFFVGLCMLSMMSCSLSLTICKCAALGKIKKKKRFKAHVNELVTPEYSGSPLKAL
jgi:hypothetical protein